MVHSGPPPLAPLAVGGPAATRRSLVDVAEALFSADGYAATSLDSIVAGAEVTKGALYHHFTGKQALFAAVFDRVEQDAAGRVRAALRDRADPSEKAMAGLRAFLEVVQEPAYRRVVIQDGPAVLGHLPPRDDEERPTFASVLDIVRAVLSAGPWDPGEELLRTFARIFLGAMSSAGESVAGADDPQAAARRVEAAIAFILSGFEALAARGAVLPDAG